MKLKRLMALVLSAVWTFHGSCAKSESGGGGTSSDSQAAGRNWRRKQ